MKAIIEVLKSRTFGQRRQYNKIAKYFKIILRLHINILVKFFSFVF